MSFESLPDNSVVASAELPGGRGQRAMAEMMRRVKVELARFNRSSTWLTVLFIFVALLQLAVAGFQAWIALKQAR
jgi:hypothetical protein